ncbi:MAG: toxic anion resistance protein, partial [Coriobacteriales bacterium]
MVGANGAAGAAGGDSMSGFATDVDYVIAGKSGSITPASNDAITASDEAILTPEERAQVDAFSKQIDVHSTNAILQYGSGAQKKMADFSESALSSVRTQDLGEVGELLTGVVTELRSFDVEDQKGIKGLFKRGANKVEGLRAKYDKVEGNVDKTVKVLQTHQMKLMKDSAMLDKLYDLNLEYYKELTMYILAGKKRLREIREGELAQLVAKARESGRTEDAQAAQDLESK